MNNTSQLEDDNDKTPGNSDTKALFKDDEEEAERSFDDDVETVTEVSQQSIDAVTPQPEVTELGETESVKPVEIVEPPSRPVIPRRPSRSKTPEVPSIPRRPVKSDPHTLDGLAHGLSQPSLTLQEPVIEDTPKIVDSKVEESDAKVTPVNDAVKDGITPELQPSIPKRPARRPESSQELTSKATTKASPEVTTKPSPEVSKKEVNKMEENDVDSVAPVEVALVEKTFSPVVTPVVPADDGQDDKPVDSVELPEVVEEVLESASPVKTLSNEEDKEEVKFVEQAKKVEEETVTPTEKRVESEKSIESEKSADSPGKDESVAETVIPSEKEPCKPIVPSRPRKTPPEVPAKHAPPKPKKLSSKIAAFQQMFNEQPQVPLKPSRPERPADKKFSTNTMKFAESLKGVVGRGVPMPGMVNPSTWKGKEKDDDDDDESEELKPIADNVRRTKGPKGKRLPKGLKDVKVEEEARFKVVIHDLWEVDFKAKVVDEVVEVVADGAKEVNDESKVEESLDINPEPAESEATGFVTEEAELESTDFKTEVDEPESTVEDIKTKGKVENEEVSLNDETVGIVTEAPKDLVNAKDESDEQDINVKVENEAHSEHGLVNSDFDSLGAANLSDPVVSASKSINPSVDDSVVEDKRVEFENVKETSDKPKALLYAEDSTSSSKESTTSGETELKPPQDKHKRLSPTLESLDKMAASLSEYIKED